MTGYGRGEQVLHDRTITVELRAVNNRYLDCSVKLPRLYVFAEEAIKAQVQKSVGRGKVDVFLTIDSAAADKVSVTLNKPVADGYYTALTQMRDAYGLRDDISVSLLSRFPDVFLVEKEQGDAEEIVADISQVLAQALEEFNAMRTREGEKLAQDIRGKAEKIAQLVNDGFSNTIPVLDNKEELELFEDSFTKKCKVGIRIACEEEPKFEFYTSRLGIRYNDIIDFYKAKLKNSKKFQLKMLHFFINTGIKDTAYYWNELSKCMNVYCELKAICPELDSLNIGGGFPIKNSLNFEYDYEYLTEEIIAQIKNICHRNDTEEPNIFTEFGSFTVGESGAALYSIVNQKQQNDRENWYMIDSSFITTLPDTWGINQRYIMLAVNNWDREYQRVLLGGLTCDSEDFYNAESHTNAIFLPKLEPGNTQYIGFFHTGAYQESLGGFGGIQHCLIPAPKHIIIDRDKSDNEYYTRLFAKEQSYRSMLRILGY